MTLNILISYRDENVIQKSKNYRIIIKNCSHKFKISTKVLMIIQPLL